MVRITAASFLFQLIFVYAGNSVRFPGDVKSSFRR